MRSKAIITALILLASAAGTAARRGDAAEIILREKCKCEGAVVRLGDMAEVLGGDGERERLLGIELFPVPPAGRERFAGVREIQDMLEMRGVKISEHRFTGASRVTVARDSVEVKQSVERPIGEAERQSASRRVRAAIVDYLNASDSAKAWGVELELNADQIKTFLGPVRQIDVSGGKSPWTGRQQFRITVVRRDQPPVEFETDARVSLPDGVVVAVRAIPRDAILCEADLALSQEVVLDNGADTFSSIAEAVGRQTMRSIPVGKVLEKSWVCRPLLVRRGEIVTVTAKTSGVKVSTNARARDDGSQGDLIAVESLQDRKPYYARVCGIRQTEVFAPTVQIREERSKAAGGGDGGAAEETELRQPRSAAVGSLKRLGKGSVK